MIIKLKYILILLIPITIFSACQRCVDIDVPYQEKEEYTEMEEQQIILDYIVNDSEWERISGIPFLDIQPYVSSYVKVQNTSDYNGEFVIDQIYKNTYGEKKRTQKTQYIAATQTAYVTFEFYLDYYEYIESVSYDIGAPTVTVQREVTKYRTITKYRKCNTCDEDCGYSYKTSIPWWVFGIVGGVLLSIFLGIVVKRI